MEREMLLRIIRVSPAASASAMLFTSGKRAQVVVYPVNVAMLLLMLRGVQRMPNAVTHL